MACPFYAYHAKYPTSRYGFSQALFGIVQGGSHRALRRESALFVASQPLAELLWGARRLDLICPKQLN